MQNPNRPIVQILIGGAAEVQAGGAAYYHDGRMFVGGANMINISQPPDGQVSPLDVGDTLWVMGTVNPPNMADPAKMSATLQLADLTKAPLSLTWHAGGSGSFTFIYANLPNAYKNCWVELSVTADDATANMLLAKAYSVNLMPPPAPPPGGGSPLLPAERMQREPK